MAERVVVGAVRALQAGNYPPSARRWITASCEAHDIVFIDSVVDLYHAESSCSLCLLDSARRSFQGK